MTMKVLQVNDAFTPVAGGVPASVYQLSKTLALKGHKVEIYASDYKIDQDYINSLLEVQVHSFHHWTSSASFYLMPSMVGEVKRKLREFDIIHLHCFRSFPDIVIHHYATKYGIPYVLQARGSLPRIVTKQNMKKVYDILWGYRLLKDAAKVIALTPIEAEQYRGMGVSQDKIEVVPNGIDLAEFDDLPERGEFRKKYALNNSQKIVLFLGRIHEIKGLDLLVEAFNGLSREIHDTKLVVAGPDDGYLPVLQKLTKELKIEDSILFTGPLYGREKLEAYVDAEVYVLPSSYEVFGRTLLEACACGTPVIVTDRCGLADVIDGQVGLVTPYDKNALSKAILDILSDNSKRQEFGENGKLLVRDKFNWDTIVNRIEDIYMRCKDQ